MATIVTRPGPHGRRYQVRIRLRAGTRSATFPTLHAAQHWATVAEAALREQGVGAGPAAVPPTLDDLLRRYAREVLPAKPPATAQNYAIYLAWWRTQLGAVRLRDLSRAQLAACRDRLAATRQGATVNRYLAMFSHALRLAVEDWAWLERNL